MKQLIHPIVSATSAVANRAAKAHFRWPLTLKSHAIRDRMNEQRQHGAVDCSVQAARKGLHQRLLSVRSLVLFAGSYGLGRAS
jgi:uncharacterized protein YicC (UPF0701 family)